MSGEGEVEWDGDRIAGVGVKFGVEIGWRGVVEMPSLKRGLCYTHRPNQLPLHVCPFLDRGEKSLSLAQWT